MKTLTSLLLLALLIISAYAAIDDPCTTPGGTECDATPNTECAVNKCTCKAGFVNDKGTCAKALGGSCSTAGNDCATIAESECVVDQCKCKDGFVGSVDLLRCLAVVTEIDGVCEEEAQCDTLGVDNSTCADKPGATPPSKACKCATSFHALDGVCWKTVDLNGACDSKYECQSLENPDFYDCNTKVCGCTRGHRVDSVANTCVKTVVGDTCTATNNVCDVTMECSTALKCACRAGFVVDGTGCRAILEGPCTVGGTECAAVTGAECNANLKCACKSGFVASTDSFKCLTVVTEIGGVCEEEAQCDTLGVDNSTCADKPGATPPSKACKCATSFHALGGSCYKTVALDGVCDSKYECQSLANPDFYDCNTNVCGCTRGHRVDSATKTCVKTVVGDACTATNNVCDETMECSTALKCACRAGFVADGTGCKAILGESCSVGGTECAAVTEAECNTNLKCACKSGFVASTDSSKCLIVVNEIGVACEDETQCNSLGVDNSTCSDTGATPPAKTCQCSSTFHELDGECFFTVALNEACDDGVECRSQENPTFYECINNKCACSKGHKVDGTNPKICVNSAGRNGVTLAAIFSVLFLIISR